MSARVEAEQATEHGNFAWSVEASTLFLKPGEWPEAIATNMGNGQPFVRHEAQKRDGELVAVVYRQAFGCLRLTVFND